MMKKYCSVIALAVGVWAAAASVAIAETGFVPLFDGRSLEGWVLMGKAGEGYVVKDGTILCPPGGGGNLFAESEYRDFILRFEFKLEEGSNNGLAIRSPLTAESAAYEGMELQILDNNAAVYQKAKPWQKHGSLYHVFPAKTGFLKMTGEWNEQEVTVEGRKVKVVLNGATILDVNLDSVTDREILARHPGLQRSSGHIGFLGHDTPIAFRNIRIREL